MLALWQSQPCKSSNIDERYEADPTRVPMPWWNKGYVKSGETKFGCPTLKSGEPSCAYGCTGKWPMCHKFLDNKCYAYHLPKYCCKGYHVRPNEPRAPDYYNEPPGKKRRGDYVASTKTFRTEQEQTDKQDLRLSRFGFFDGEPQTQDLLEKSYWSHKNVVKNSQDSSADQKRQLKKLKSAFRNIGKALQNRAPSPSTDDEDRALRTSGRAYA